MDSLTQAVLGATVAAACAGKRANAKVLLGGAALGTLPDLDVLIDYGDPLQNMIKHRGFSHSLFVLFPLSLILAAPWYRFVAPSWGYRKLAVLFSAVLITHPLLDAFTNYGTQLFWPQPYTPTAISSIFIIDPLYTLPLLLATLFGLFLHDKAARLAKLALGVSSAYLLWSVSAQHWVDRLAQDYIEQQDLTVESRLVSPTPFNTLLWRVLLIEDDAYYEGFYSLLDEQPKLSMTKHPLCRPKDFESEQLRQFQQFTSAKLRYQQQGAYLNVTDLRIGMSDYYPFSFYLAERNPSEAGWQDIQPVAAGAQTRPLTRLPKLFLRMMAYSDTLE